TVEELFIAAADAVMNVMVADLETIAPQQQCIITVTAEDHEMLLFELLQELIFYKDAEQLLLRVNGVSISVAAQGLTLRAEAAGEMLDPGRHDLGVDVKAVTMHRYKVEQNDRGWYAMVILDI
ncbi:MAG: archease, partial [Deltaproteobacteria bacterium]|nr:archease [Deltaproteobacteria bacterium]